MVSDSKILQLPYYNILMHFIEDHHLPGAHWHMYVYHKILSDQKLQYHMSVIYVDLYYYHIEN